MTIRGGGNPILDMAYVPRFRMGPLPWSFAADAYDCIMVQLAIEPTGYKFVARWSRLDGELPSDCLTPSRVMDWKQNPQNDKPDRLPEPPRKRDSHD
jgi:hypothetical protein